MIGTAASRSRRSDRLLRSGQCVTRRTGCSVSHRVRSTKATPSGETIYLGSPQSQTLLRIYDKRLESQAKQREDWQDYGIRWELELKKDRAQVCGQVLSYLEETDWLGIHRRAYCGAMWISEPRVRDEEDEFRYRAPLLDWWLQLTEVSRKAVSSSEKDAQTLPKVKRWVSRVRRARCWPSSVPPILVGRAWLDQQIVAGKKRWKAAHRRLVELSNASSGYDQ